MAVGQWVNYTICRTYRKKGGFFMPYKDKDKQREAERRSREKAREKKKAAEAEAKSGPDGTDPAPPPGAKTIPANKKDVKKRNWWFVLYPESAPPDWRDRLRATGLPIA